MIHHIVGTNGVGAGEADDHATGEKEVFKAIVSMCSIRILQRLRLARAPRDPENKNPIDEILGHTMNCARDQAISNSMKSKLSSFLKAGNEVVKSVNAWRKYKSVERLETIVEKVYQLHRLGAIEELLRGISNKVMDPSSKRGLVNMVAKVARYRQAARLLLRSAREFPIVSRVKVDGATLPAAMFDYPPPVGNYNPSLPTTVQRLGQKYSQKRNMSKIRDLLSAQEASLETQFAGRTRHILEKARIHAEVQLVIYCDRQLPKQMLPPRVVSSSKDACYLCNLFIGNHGKVHIPGSHGRLYPGWRLPVHPELGQLQGAFNQRLENQLRQSLDKLLINQKKTVHPHPNESTLLTLSPSLLTLKSGLLSRSGSQLAVSEKNEDRAISEVISLPPPSSVMSFPTTTVRAENSRSVHATFDTVVGSTAMTPVDTHPRTNDVGNGSAQKLLNVEESYVLEPPSRYQRSFLLNIPGVVELELEGPDGSKGKSAVDQNYYSFPLDTVEWLTAEEATSARQCHPRCIVQAESIEGEVTHALCSENNFFVIVRGHALRLRFQ